MSISGVPLRPSRHSRIPRNPARRQGKDSESETDIPLPVLSPTLSPLASESP